MFTIFKDDVEARKLLKAFFYRQNYTKYYLERFLSIYGEKMSKGFLKFCKFISNLKLGKLKIIVNQHKLNSHISHARFH